MTTSATNTTQQDFTGSTATKDQLRSIIERVERLMEEKKNLSLDINEVLGEAKGNGYNVKVIKQLIKLRALDPSEVQELDSLLDLYKHALGMV